MSSKSFGQEFAEEVVRKAVIYGPPIVGGLALGPAGIVVGAVAAAVVVTSSGSKE